MSETAPSAPAEFETVSSADGTSIAYERVGSGPALIVVGGAFSVRQGGYPLREVLSDTYTVYALDRRGRGDSTDVQPYHPEREIEDIQALVAAAGADGGPVYVYGHSSGAMLALESASRGLPIARLAVYEAPYTFNPADPTQGDAARAAVLSALETGDREAAVEAFLRLTGADDSMISWMRGAPFWPGMVAIAHTTAYDLALAGDSKVPPERFAAVGMPVLVLDGGASPPWAARASEALVAALPDARRHTIEGQGHGPDPELVAAVLREFFA